MKLQVNITDDADADLIAVARHYDELDRLEAGRELVNRIYKEIAKLPLTLTAAVPARACPPTIAEPL
ncbi:MAG: hypothetical protein DLM69_01320 [Candidatus Chloroheliales bacterium]|nr:MAG: hypothetical protein DLM69_01320 [Chloroflexota bacterium]